MPRLDKVAAVPELTPLRTIDESKDAGAAEAGGFKLRKEIGLLDGVAIIVGCIVGAGIFVSPKGVLKSAGSVGLALIIWILSGLLSLVGALCYAELGKSKQLEEQVSNLDLSPTKNDCIFFIFAGTMIPKSGGDYAYINEAFGPLPAFLYLWVALFVIIPTGNAITALTFAQYILQPLWPACNPPITAIRLIAAIMTCKTFF